MQIRRATISDAAEACALLRRSISELCVRDHRGDPEFLAKWLSNKTVENVRRWILETHFFVAEENGALLGCAAMTSSGMITLNYVAPEARFHGVSKALMMQLEAVAAGLGLAECRLESTQTALSFYRGLRYVESGESYLLPLTGSPALVLKKALQPPSIRSHRPESS